MCEPTVPQATSRRPELENMCHLPRLLLPYYQVRIPFVVTTGYAYLTYIVPITNSYSHWARCYLHRDTCNMVRSQGVNVFILQKCPPDIAAECYVTMPCPSGILNAIEPPANAAVGIIPRPRLWRGLRS